MLHRLAHPISNVNFLLCAMYIEKPDLKPSSHLSVGINPRQNYAAEVRKNFFSLIIIYVSVRGRCVCVYMCSQACGGLKMMSEVSLNPSPLPMLE